MGPARAAAALSVAMFIATVVAGWASPGHPPSVSTLRALHLTASPSSLTRSLVLPDRVVPVATGPSPSAPPSCALAHAPGSWAAGWQVGHQKRRCWPIGAARTGVVQTWQGRPARPYTA